MTPIHLELQAFGAYPTRQDVPFAKLDRIFLIGGDTGAGKTTIFDAITYALYGKALGTRERENVRSTLAPADVSTYVLFRFAVGGKTWEIYRSDHQVRPRQRGTGVMVEKALWIDEIAPDGTATRQSGRPSVLDEMIRSEIIHLRYDDFAKILVLPQGEFQKFLEMDSTRRAAILETVFRTDDHRKLTEAAKAAVASVNASAKQIEIARNEVMSDAARKAGGDDERALQDGVDGGVKRERERQPVADAARKALEAANALAAMFAAQLRALGEQAEHALGAAAADLAKAQLEAGRRAGRANHAIQAEVGLREQVAEAGEKARMLAAALADQAAKEAALKVEWERLPERELAARDADAQIARLALRTAELGRLSAAVGDVRRYGIVEEAAQTAVPTRQQELAARSAELEALAAVQIERDALAPGLKEAADTTNQLATWTPTAALIDNWETSVVPARAALERELADKAAEVAAAVARAAEDVREARERFEGQAAALLAATLRDEEACPVCGSTDHPSPTHASASEDDLRARVKSAAETLTARLGEASAHDARTAAEASVHALRSAAVDKARAELTAAGFAGPPAWQAALADAARESTRLTAEDMRLGAILKGRAALAVRTETARKALTEAVAAAANAGSARAGAEGTRDAILASVGAVENIPGALQTTAEAHAERARAAKVERLAITTLRTTWEAVVKGVAAAAAAVSTNATHLEALQVALTNAGVAVANALTEHRFADAAAVRAALLDVPTEARLDQQLAEWTRRSTELTTTLTTLTGQIADRAPPDLPAIEAESTAALAALREATESRCAAESDLETLRKRVSRYDALTADLSRLTADSKVMLQLARDLSGENGKRLPFPTYILTWWLSQVLLHANTRLHSLSNGQYTLQLRADVGDKRSLGGLDLDVLDGHSASLRDVTTLSGGEKFLASISLALGLADVIQARDGGIELDTLFIDEGFGSLDPAAMDRALTIIEEIGASRRVGIISHVESVRTSIPCHVIVEKTREGSRIRVEGGV